MSSPARGLILTWSARRSSHISGSGASYMASAAAAIACVGVVSDSAVSGRIRPASHRLKSDAAADSSPTMGKFCSVPSFPSTTINPPR